MSDNKADHNHVRQVLMNELGLTRDSVRQDVVKIVTDTVERFINTPDFQGRIVSIIEAKVGSAMKQYGNADVLKKFVETQVSNEAAAQARELVREHLSVVFPVRTGKTAKGGE